MLYSKETKAIQFTRILLEKAIIEAKVVALKKQLAFAIDIISSDEDCPDEYFLDNVGCEIDNEHLHLSCAECWRLSIERKCK